MRPSKTILGTLLITSAMGLALAACDRNTPAQQPLSSADLALPATAASTSPGPVNDRYGPPPKKISVGRVSNPRDDWAWAERSYALDNAFYDTAPDYGFYDDGYEPWVWQTSDRWAMYEDPYDYGYDWDDDGYYYYYQPGAVRPYFIRDASYGYGFDDVGRLVVVYDLLGRIMPQSFLYEREPYVSRYYQRAYMVRQTSLRVQPVVITQQVWQQRAPVVQRYQQRWIQAARTQPQWVDYRQRSGDRFVRAFEGDRQQRQQRTFAANGQPQQSRGFLANTPTRNREAQPAQVAQNGQERRGFLGLGGNGRDRQQRQGVEQQPFAQADRGSGRDRQRQERANQVQALSQAQPNQDRRGVFTGRDRRQDQVQQRQAEAQPRQDNGRQRQELARQQQAQQRQAEAQPRQDNGRQRQEMARQQQAQQRQVEAQSRQDNGRQRQEMARQQQAQQRQAEAQARQEQGRQRQEAARQEQAQQRQAEAQSRQQQQAQQRQAEAQARQQQQAQQHQAEAQARQQQQAQQRQAEAQSRQQQQAQQRQAEAQARQQQQAQQAQARQQQRAQPQQRAPQEADAQPQQNGGGHGHGKKG